MINLDDRFITDLMPYIKPNGVAVILAIAKHCNVQKKAFPSNKRLCKLTGLSINTVKNTLEMLRGKGLIKTEERYQNGRQLSNVHTINTSFIKIFVAAKALPFEGEEDAQKEGSNSDDMGGQILTGEGSNSDDMGGQILTGEGSNSDPEVLTRGSINQKEVLTRRRRKKAAPTADKDFLEKKGIVQDVKKNDAPPLVAPSPPQFDKILEQDCAWMNQICAAKKIAPKEFKKKHLEFHQYKKLMQELNHKNYKDYRKNFFAWLGKSLEKQGSAQKSATNSKIIKSSKYDKYRK